MTAISPESVIAFLRRIPPFQFLDPATLERVSAHAEIHYFPRGTVIIRRGGTPSRYLYAIERGGVKKTFQTETGDEVLVEVAGEHELFGVLSSLESDVARLDVTAIEDTVCYAVPRPVVDELMASHPPFARYLLQFSLRRYLDWSLEEVRHSAGRWDSGGQLLFAGQARDLARSPLVSCRETTTIQEAARLMSANRVSSVLVLDEAGQASGIITDWDLRDRVVALGRDLREAVGPIASSPVVTIDGDEPISEVVRLMIERNIHHLVVTHEGRPVGMITGHDLIVLQGTSALFIAREIDRQTSPAGLRRVLDQAQQVIPFLLHQGVRAGHLGRIMAEINDRLVARVLGFVEQTLGPPPLPYCWIVLGSEGRREQTFKTDQDNGLIYLDPPPDTAEATRAYFLEFGQRAVAALVEAGFPPCPGRYTADNPLWTQPLGGWVEHFRRWTVTPEPEAVLNSLIFFDFRGVAGDLALASRLRQAVTGLMGGSRAFLVHLAHLSTRQSPPIGFLGRLVVERSGEHKNELDLKLRGTGPVVDLARFFSLRHGVAEPNTLERLEQLRAGGHLPEGLVDELGQAFEFLLSLRIRRQWEQRRAGQPLSNYIDPRDLSGLDRNLLRAAFQVIAQTQAVVREEYHSEAVAS